jgi:hypothetical protein
MPSDQLQTPTIVAAVIAKEISKSHRCVPSSSLALVSMISIACLVVCDSNAQGVWSPLGEPYHRHGSFAVDLSDEKSMLH